MIAARVTALELQIHELKRISKEDTEHAAAAEAEATELQRLNDEARESCAKIAEEWRITDPANTIGPLWVSGWNEACHKIAESIRGRDDRVKRNDEPKPPAAWKEHWLRAAQFLKSHDAGSDNFSEGWHEAANKIEERAGMVDREPYTH